MSTDADPYAAFRPQQLQHPYRVIGWTMIVRGLVTAAFGLFAIASIAPALRVGRFEIVTTLLGFGFGFIYWGARTLGSGIAIAIRFNVKPSAPSDLAARIDPLTDQSIGYGNCAYGLQDLRDFFLRKELPDKRESDLIDEIVAKLGRAGQPIHPSKRDLIIDVLRGAIASTALLVAFAVAFGVIQFDPVMRNQPALTNLVFLVAYLLVFKYWGLTPEARASRTDISLRNLFWQIGVITLVAVTLPVLLTMSSPVAPLFSRIEVFSPFSLLVGLVILGAVALAIVVSAAATQSRRKIYTGKAIVSISELPTVEAYARLLPKDLLNAFARFIGSSRSLSLDDRVYSFTETRGQGRDNQPSDHAEYIAESAPLLRLELVVSGTQRLILLSTAFIGEVLIFLCTIVLFLTMTAYVEFVRQIVADFLTQNYGGLSAILSDPLLVTALFVVLFWRFGSLFREIGTRFLREVVFQSYVVAVAISSTIGEAALLQSDRSHFFDGGRTSTIRIRIQAARAYTTTLVSMGAGDSLGGPRYLIGAEREDRLLQALGQEANRYIEARTSAAMTRVRSETVEMKNAGHLLVDAGGWAALTGKIGAAAQVQYNLGANPLITDSRNNTPDEPEG